MDGIEWGRMDRNYLEKFYGEGKKYEIIMIKYEWVTIFHEEGDRKPNEIPFIICGLNL